MGCDKNALFARNLLLLKIVRIKSYRIVPYFHGIAKIIRIAQIRVLFLNPNLTLLQAAISQKLLLYFTLPF